MRVKGWPGPLFAENRAFVAPAGRGRSRSFSSDVGTRGAPDRTQSPPDTGTREFRERERENRQFRPRGTSFTARSDETAVAFRPYYGWQFGNDGDDSGRGGRGRRDGRSDQGGGGGRQDRRRLPEGRGWEFDDHVLLIPKDLRPILVPYLDAVEDLTEEQLQQFLVWVSELFTTGVEAVTIFLRVAARVGFNLSVLKPVHDLVMVMATVVQSGRITPADAVTVGVAMASLAGPAGPVAALARGAVPRLFTPNPSGLQVATAVFDAVAAEFGTSASTLLRQLGNAAIKATQSLAARAAVDAQRAGGGVLAGAAGAPGSRLDALDHDTVG
jgi:hypothetical protein